MPLVCFGLSLPPALWRWATHRGAALTAAAALMTVVALLSARKAALRTKRWRGTPASGGGSGPPDSSSSMAQLWSSTNPTPLQIAGSSSSAVYEVNHDTRDTILRLLRAVVSIRRMNVAKLAQVNAQLEGVAQGMESSRQAVLAELQRVVDKGSSASTGTREAALINVRALESLLDGCVLGALLPTKAITNADTDHVAALKVLRKRLMAHLVRYLDAFTSTLSPGACFFIGAFVAAEAHDRATREAVLALLLKATESTAARYPLPTPFPSQTEVACPVLTSLPLQETVPVYAPSAWFVLGKLLDSMSAGPKEEGSRRDSGPRPATPNAAAAKTAAESGAVTVASDAASRESLALVFDFFTISPAGPSVPPTSTRAYQRCLELSNGSYAAAWHFLGFALMERGIGAIRVLGTSVSRSQCFAEVIRCRGGRHCCVDPGIWRDVAAFLRTPATVNATLDTLLQCYRDEKDTWRPPPSLPPRRSSAGRRGVARRVAGESQQMLLDEVVMMTTQPNVPFLCSQRFRDGRWEAVGKRDALVQYLTCTAARGDEPSAGAVSLPAPDDAAEWVELAMCLSHGPVLCQGQERGVATPHKAGPYESELIIAVDGERVECRGRVMGRYECLTEALHCDPMHVLAWLAAGLSLEDAAMWRRRYPHVVVESGACRWPFLGPSEPALTRLDCLQKCLELDGTEYRAWLALGLTLRQRATGGRQSPVTPSSSKTTPRTPNAAESVQTRYGVVTAESCFAKCIAACPAVGPLLEQWRHTTSLAT